MRNPLINRIVPHHPKSHTDPKSHTFLISRKCDYYESGQDIVQLKFLVQSEDNFVISETENLTKFFQKTINVSTERGTSTNGG